MKIATFNVDGVIERSNNLLEWLAAMASLIEGRTDDKDLGTVSRCDHPVQSPAW